METMQAIQTSAKVVRITEIKTGDVYKRFDESYDDRVYYGIVRNVHNDGENTIIEATEYHYQYSSLTIDYKVLRGQKDYILFPCTPEEMNFDLEKAKKSKLKAIEDAKETIEKNTKLIKEIDGLISGETQKELSAMAYKELSQASYNEKKALL